MSSQAHEPRIVVVGGGFGGLTFTKLLRNEPVQVTLLDRRNFHLFQPLLYQVATGGLSPANIAAPLRAVLKRQRNARVLLAEVQDFDLSGQRVHTNLGDVAFDILVVAAGATHSYFGNDHWSTIAPGLKTIEDATEIRRRVLGAFEAAETATDPNERAAWMTFVVVGGGPTGVELAGAIAELANHTLRSNFRTIDSADAKIFLLEAADRLLLNFPPSLSAKAKRSLERLGVTTCLGAKVTALEPARVVYETGGSAVTLTARTVLWGAGVQGSPLGKKLAAAAGVEVDRQGRVKVSADLTVPGHPSVFVIGDLAHCEDKAGHPLPGVAPVAMQQGRHVARLLRNRRLGRPTPPFSYRSKGNMATIGRGAAVTDLGWVRLAGYPAWLAWLFVHLLFLVGFHNRFLVLFQWAWCYLTRNRSARLMTGSNTQTTET